MHASPHTPPPLALIMNAVVPAGRGLLAITSSLLIVQGMVVRSWFFHSAVVAKPTTAFLISPLNFACMR